MAGVSHRTDSHSLKEFTEAGAALMRTWRRSGATGCVPVPISTSPSLRGDREAAFRRRSGPSPTALLHEVRALD